MVCSTSSPTRLLSLYVSQMVAMIAYCFLPRSRIAIGSDSCSGMHYRPDLGLEDATLRAVARIMADHTTEIQHTAELVRSVQLDRQRYEQAPILSHGDFNECHQGMLCFLESILR